MKTSDKIECTLWMMPKHFVVDLLANAERLRKDSIDVGLETFLEDLIGFCNHVLTTSTWWMRSYDESMMHLQMFGDFIKHFDELEMGQTGGRA